MKPPGGLLGLDFSPFLSGLAVVLRLADLSARHPHHSRRLSGAGNGVNPCAGLRTAAGLYRQRDVVHSRRRLQGGYDEDGCQRNPAKGGAVCKPMQQFVEGRAEGEW